MRNQATVTADDKQTKLYVGEVFTPADFICDDAIVRIADARSLRIEFEDKKCCDYVALGALPNLEKLEIVGGYLTTPDALNSLRVFDGAVAPNFRDQDANEANNFVMPANRLGAGSRIEFSGYDDLDLRALSKEVVVFIDGAEHVKLGQCHPDSVVSAWVIETPWIARCVCTRLIGASDHVERHYCGEVEIFATLEEYEAREQ